MNPALPKDYKLDISRKGWMNPALPKEGWGQDKRGRAG